MRDIQEIIREAAERYGLKYDETQENPKRINKDGSITQISKEDFEKAFKLK